MFGLTPFDKKNSGLEPAGNYRSELDPFFDRFFGSSMTPFFGGTFNQMKVDIRETKDAYILDADLPGIKKDQIHLDADQDRLLISVEADENYETKSEGYICRERRSGRIARSFPLTNIDAENITASLDNGTLTVNMPKKNKEMPTSRHIDIA